ncbi:MAG: hypothetical protein GY705_29450 [Bacteroidetes bacterium]|nr:hypothetical protein [Bacteroidota bacterium]
MVGEEQRDSGVPGIPACFIFDSKDAPFDGLNVCRAAVEVSGPGSIHGAQKIGLIYRIYAKTIEARQTLIEKGLNLNNTHVSVLHANPFLTRGEGDRETVRVTVRDIPWSVSSSEIVSQIEKFGAAPRSRLFNEHYRETEGPEKGKLTSFLTGHRFIYIDKPTNPLPRSIKVGIFTGRLYHFGQPKKTDLSVTQTKHREDNENVWTKQNKTRTQDQVNGDKEIENDKDMGQDQNENNSECEEGEVVEGQNEIEKEIEAEDGKKTRQADITSFIDRSRRMARRRTGSLDSGATRPRSGSKRRGTDKGRERAPKAKSRRTQKDRSPSRDSEEQGLGEFEREKRNYLNSSIK